MLPHTFFDLSPNVFLDDLVSAIFEFIGGILSAIGDLLVWLLDSVFGAHTFVIVVPSCVAVALLAGAGTGALAGGTGMAVLSIVSLIVAGLVLIILLLAVALSARRRRPGDGARPE
jgi:hypothetical protein